MLLEPSNQNHDLIASLYKIHSDTEYTPDIYLYGAIHGLRHHPGIQQTPYDSAKLEIIAHYLVEHSIKPTLVIFEGTAHASAAKTMAPIEYQKLYKRDSESYLAESALKIGAEIAYLEITKYHKCILASSNPVLNTLMGVTTYQTLLMDYPRFTWSLDKIYNISEQVALIGFAYLLLSRLNIATEIASISTLLKVFVLAVFIKHQIYQGLHTEMAKNVNVHLRDSITRVKTYFDTLQITKIDPRQKAYADTTLSLTSRNQRWADKILHFITKGSISLPEKKNFFARTLHRLENVLDNLFPDKEYDLPILAGDAERLAEHKSIIEHIKQSCEFSVPQNQNKKAILFCFGASHLEGLVEELEKRGVKPMPCETLPGVLWSNVKKEMDNFSIKSSVK